MLLGAGNIVENYTGDAPAFEMPTFSHLLSKYKLPFFLLMFY